MLRALYISLFALLLSSAQGQSLKPREIASLPSGLSECSGMAFIDDNAIVMINDSGNEAELFVCDTLGNLLLRPRLLGLPNRDWESLSYHDGLLYIGDFGNNGNQRKDLEILIVDVSNLLTAKEWSLKGRINYTYPEQESFPPKNDSAFYYDLEAMIYERDSLFLFTKNRTKPFDGLVKVYGLSAKAGTQEAKLIKEFRTGLGLKHFNWVSGASIGPNKHDLFLLGYNKLWYIEDWRNTTELQAFPFSLGFFSQKEAVDLQAGKLYFAEEKNPGREAKLYSISTDIFSIKQEWGSNEAVKLNSSLRLGDSLKLDFAKPYRYLNTPYFLYQTDGTAVFEGVLDENILLSGSLVINMEGLSAGNYILSLEGFSKEVFVIRLR